jgi:hypothetical protein
MLTELVGAIRSSLTKVFDERQEDIAIYAALYTSFPFLIESFVFIETDYAASQQRAKGCCARRM